MKKIINKLKKITKKINFKSKRTIFLLCAFILTVLTSIVLLTYSYYINNDNDLMVSGVAMINGDVKLKIYRENRNSSGTGTGEYLLIYYVPKNNYTYMPAKTVCSSNVSIASYNNYTFNLSASSRGYCKVYFDAVDGFIEDYSIDLFVEKEVDSLEYTQMGMLPLYETGYYYTINTARTSCTNGATVSILGRQIVVTTTSKATCVVYVDKNVDNVGPALSAVNLNNTIISATATDSLSLGGYGVSRSRTVEPSEWIAASGTSQNISYEFASDGTEDGIQYLWVKDSANNKVVSSSFYVDTQGPTFSLAMNGTTLSGAITDDVSLNRWGISPSTSVEPSTWTNVSGTSTNISIPIVTSGVFYIWAEDINDNITKSLGYSSKCNTTFVAYQSGIAASGTYSTECTGTYKLEVWGAQGGTYSATYYGGYGGYSTGDISLSVSSQLFIKVGGAGIKTTSTALTTGGFNGGGSCYSGSSSYPGTAITGGGASDIRLETDSLYSRIIVAGGGGGSNYYSSTYSANTTNGQVAGIGGHGGGLTGVSRKYSTSTSYFSGGGTQTSGGDGYSTYDGIFGSGNTTATTRSSGGGGGWYGGSSGRRVGGGGGSSWLYTSSSYTTWANAVTIETNWFEYSLAEGSRHYLNESTSYTCTTNASGVSSCTNSSGANYGSWVPSGTTNNGTGTIGQQGDGYARITYVP